KVLFWPSSISEFNFAPSRMPAMKFAKCKHIVGLAFDFTDHPAVQVIDFAIVAGQRERTFFAIERDTELRVFKSARVTALALPDDSLVPEIKISDTSIRRFPVILKMITITAAGDPARRIHSETPPG